MDTDNLSREAYDGVIIEAENFSRDLTLNFISLLSYCKNEMEFLEQVKKMIIEIKQLDNDELEDILFGNIVDRIKLNYTLDIILENIIIVNKVPVNKRHYEY